MTYQIPRSVSIQRAIPTLGSTVVCGTTDSPVCMILVDNPALLASATLDFQPGSFDGQLIRLSFKSAITLLTMTGSGITFLGALASAVSGGYAAFVWDKDGTTWRRCA